jgi:transcription-repair coupling factor (superfamily II helicase)
VQTTELIALYQKQGWTKSLAELLETRPKKVFHMQGLAGSLPAVLGAALNQLNAPTQCIILPDKETAAYFYSDLQNLLASKTILLYAADTEPPYTTPGTPSTNNSLYAEALQQLTYQKEKVQFIVTYPEALVKRVIAQHELTARTWSIRVGDQVILTDLVSKLTEQGFEKTEFVYEAGQFAVRGGILDVFSYSHQLPYRLELFGKAVESIRTFDPTDQRSVESAQQILIMPGIKQPKTTIDYQSFFQFLPADTWIWLKDHELILSSLEQSYQKAQAAFKDIQAEKESHQMWLPPDILYESSGSWEEEIQKFTRIEFGHRFYLMPDQVINYQSTVQPTFGKRFELLADNLQQNQHQGLVNIVVAESPDQFDLLAHILSELNAHIQFQTVQMGLSQGFIDPQVGIACYTDHQLFGRYYRYKTPKRYSKTKAITLREIQALQTGDYVVHVDYGIARFAGLSKVLVHGKEQEVLRLVYKDNDTVYISLHALHKISKYASKEGMVPVLTKLGTSAWDQKKSKVKRKVQDIAKELIQTYAKRWYTPGFAFSKDTTLQVELEASFMYEDTPDQAAATAEVKRDMEAPRPMDRLVCGDVGFGKTEVAIRAAFKAIQDGKQVAVLVPTTILALQHYETFESRLTNFPVTIQYINRFKATHEIDQVYKDVAEGKVDILIGTHRILNKSLKFKDLGLLIIDEEQKFGVKAKDRLKELRANIDVLTLTATPIPRTLHFSLMGARDLSIIATPPPNRQPVETKICRMDKQWMQEAIYAEMQRGGQIFFVHNRVANIEEVASMVHKLVPEARIGIAHGQMDGDQLEKQMMEFIKGEYDILVSTNIIESGLDIPNANTIIINDSHMFGLSDLHQMRGRVGRSNRKAFCYLIAPPSSALTEDARRRLSALEEFSELGSGFKLAMRDLDIRGAGNLLGAEQSGFIADVGFETYCKILDDAVKELKEREFKELFADELTRKTERTAADCTIETDLEVLIPNNYINSDTERLRLYIRLDNLETQGSLEAFQQELQDRFGPLPDPVKALIQVVQLRWIAKQLGITKIKLKENTMSCYFASNQQQKPSAHLSHNLLAYIQQHPHRCQLKEVKEQITWVVRFVKDIAEAQVILNELTHVEVKQLD